MFKIENTREYDVFVCSWMRAKRNYIVHILPHKPKTHTHTQHSYSKLEIQEETFRALNTPLI